MKDCKARIDSFYHGSAVDGEGLRSVLFFSGCNLRCPFCHNPETLYGNGKEISLSDAVNTVKRFLPYLKGGGGITLSGGEPFLQSDFCRAFSDEVHALNLTVIAETNGTIADAELIRRLDGVRLDIKNQNGENGETLLNKYSPFLYLCRDLKKDVLLTNVLVPSINDGKGSVSALAAIKNTFPFTRGVEFLPFRKLCVKKYEELNIPFPFNDIPEATASDCAKALKLFRSFINL